MREMLISSTINLSVWHGSKIFTILNLAGILTGLAQQLRLAGVLYAFDDKVASVIHTDVTDDVMPNAEPVEELDHVVGIATQIGNVRLQSESVVVDEAFVRRGHEYERLAIPERDASPNHSRCHLSGVAQNVRQQ